MKMVIFTIHHQHGSHNARKMSPILDLCCHSHHTVCVRALLSCSKSSTRQWSRRFQNIRISLLRPAVLERANSSAYIYGWEGNILLASTNCLLNNHFDCPSAALWSRHHAKDWGKLILKDHSSHVWNYLKIISLKSLNLSYFPYIFLHHCWLPRYLHVRWNLSLPIISYLLLFDLFLHWCHT